MAKKRRAGRLEDTAESIGAALGQLAGRFDAWKQQRTELSAELQRVMKSAQTMLEGLGRSNESTASKRAATRSRSKGGRPKGFAVSDETRAKLRAAWERRRAAGSKAPRGAQDERRMIRQASGRKFSNRQRGKG